MNNEIIIFMNDHTSLQIDCVIKKKYDTFLKVHELQEGKLPLFLEIEHKQVNTMLELAKVYPFVLLYFIEETEKYRFEGATYSLNKFNIPYSVNTQYKKILVHNYPISFKLEDLSYLTFIS